MKFKNVCLSAALVSCLFVGCSQPPKEVTCKAFEELQIPENVVVKSNNNEQFLAEVQVSGQNEYDEYVEECKELFPLEDGFFTDSEFTIYSGYTEAGDNLVVFYDERDKNDLKIVIEVMKSLVEDEFTWPDNKYTQLIPELECTHGKQVTKDAGPFWAAHIGDKTKEDFLNYVEACKESGYVDVVQQGENNYRARSKDNIQVNVEYYPYGGMFINVSDVSDISE